jgi:hypothetical protein
MEALAEQLQTSEWRRQFWRGGGPSHAPPATTEPSLPRLRHVEGGTAALHEHPAALSAAPSDSSNRSTGEAPVTQGEGGRISTRSLASARHKPPSPQGGPNDSRQAGDHTGAGSARKSGRHGRPHCMRGATSACGEHPRREPRRAPRAPPWAAAGRPPHSCTEPRPHQEAADPGQWGADLTVGRTEEPPPTTLEGPCRRPWKGKEGEERVEGATTETQRHPVVQDRRWPPPPGGGGRRRRGGGALAAAGRSPPESPCASGSGDGPCDRQAQFASP